MSDKKPTRKAREESSTEGVRDAVRVASGKPAPPKPQRGNLDRLLVDSVRDYAIFALDPEGYILTWNPGAERFKGYKADEIIGKHFSVFYPDTDRAAGKPEWELEVAKEKGSVEDEGWRVRKDGSQFWASVVITALRDETGSLVGFAKVTRDLTERRLVEQTLRQSEERMRLLVENVSDYGIFTLDPSGIVQSWNAGANRISGYSADEVIGKHFSIFYPQEDVSARRPDHELEIASKAGRFEEEGWRLRKGGDRFWSNVVITALRSDDGRLVGFAKLTRDLTERRAATERALADARRVATAEGANRAKSDFLTAMSHELRTPLNAIGGYAELLTMGLGGPISSEQLDYLDRIRRSQQHLLGIINDILNFSRIEAGQIVYDIRPVAVAEVVDSVIPMIVPQAEAKGLRVTTSVSAAICVLADRGKLEQVLLNLLSNAVKFTVRGTIEITGFMESDNAGLRVRDTGIGVPKDKLHSIFEPFVQVGRSLTTPHEGTGLGLAISRDLTKAMGGDLTADSQMGKGTTFTVTLHAADRSRS